MHAAGVAPVANGASTSGGAPHAVGALFRYHRRRAFIGCEISFNRIGGESAQGFDNNYLADLAVQSV